MLRQLVIFIIKLLVSQVMFIVLNFLKPQLICMWQDNCSVAFMSRFYFKLYSFSSIFYPYYFRLGICSGTVLDCTPWIDEVKGSSYARRWALSKVRP